MDPHLVDGVPCQPGLKSAEVGCSRQCVRFIHPEVLCRVKLWDAACVLLLQALQGA